jgi:hypothetical protein
VCHHLDQHQYGGCGVQPAHKALHHHTVVTHTAAAARGKAHGQE